MYKITIKTPSRVLHAESPANSASKAMLDAQRIVYEQLDNKEQKRFTISIIKER